MMPLVDEEPLTTTDDETGARMLPGRNLLDAGQTKPLTCQESILFKESDR